jgi:hypothetical protein
MMNTFLIKAKLDKYNNPSAGYRFDIIDGLTKAFYWHRDPQGRRYQVVQKHELNRQGLKKGKSPWFQARVRGYNVKALFFAKDGQGRYWFYVTRTTKTAEKIKKETKTEVMEAPAFVDFDI